MSGRLPDARSTAAGACPPRRARRVARAAVSLLWLAVALAPAVAPPPVSAAGDHDTPDAKGGVPYAVARWTIDGGGGRSSGGTYAVNGTIAQPDADPLQPSTGGSYAITGGFWPGMMQGVAGTDLFADGFEPR